MSRPFRDDDDQTTATGAAPAGPAIGPGLGAPDEDGSTAAPNAPTAPLSAHAKRLATFRYGVLSASHALIDVFPILFIVLNLPLKDRLGLTAWQVDAVYMATPIFSGLLQPVFAWMSDKLNTRVFSPLGLLIGCVCISSIGFAQNFWQLIALQIVGVIATGFYHPVSTALAGQTAARAFKGGRALAVGLFIAAGMVGQSLSSYLTPQLVDKAGMTALVWYMIPGILMAVVLHMVIRHIPHRAADHHEVAARVPKSERLKRWLVVGSLTVQNCLRFTVNVGLFAMFNVWAASKIVFAPAGDDADALRAAERVADIEASKVAGTLIAATTVGMGLSVVVSGYLSRRGHERLWLALLSFVGAAVVASLGFVGDLVVTQPFTKAPGLVELAPLMLLAALAPIGFFSTFPIAASLGQRLQPAHTSVVMSLLMGVGWAVSASNVLLARLFLGDSVRDAPQTASALTINTAFLGFAALLLLAGILAAAMPKRIVASVAHED